MLRFSPHLLLILWLFHFIQCVVLFTVLFTSLMNPHQLNSVFFPQLVIPSYLYFIHSCIFILYNRRMMRLVSTLVRGRCLEVGKGVKGQRIMRIHVYKHATQKHKYIHVFMDFYGK